MSDTFSQAETSADSYAIDSAAASITVYSVPAGRKFVIYDLCLQVEADGTLQLKSGATNITGPINLLAATQPPLRIANAGFPIFRGRGDGDDFIIANAGTVQVNGWVLLKEVQS